MISETRLRDGIRPLSLHFCRVMNVHPQDYTVDVAGENLIGPLERLSYASPYVHFANGEGIYFIPEVGSWCWVCLPSDHKEPFVLTFAPVFGGDDYKANRLDLGPGDLAMISRDENGIIVRRGGITQVSATPVCQRIYTPIGNTIRDLCENYELSAAGGQLKWTTSRGIPSEQNQSPSELVLEAREFAQGDPVVILRVGSVETPKSEPSKGPRLSAGKKVYLDIEVVGAFRYRVNVDGESLQVQEGRRSVHVKDAEIYVVDGNREFQVFSEDVNVKNESVRSYGSEAVTVKGESKETVRKKTIIAPTILLGSEAAEPTVFGRALLTWLKTHVHGTAAGPTTPPIQTIVDQLFLTRVVKVS